MKRDIKKGKAVLALGEISNHSHRFKQEVGYLENEKGLAQELVIDEPAELVHEEHETVTIPKGEFTVILQREYDVTVILFIIVTIVHISHSNHLSP